MQIPVQITFRDIPRSGAVEAAVREKTRRLEHFFEHIMICRITLGVIQKDKHQGKLFNVCLDLKLPGTEIVINRDKAEDIHVAIRDAFDAAKHQLDARLVRLHGRVKTDEARDQDPIALHFPEEGCGFIEKAVGAELNFHEHKRATRGKHRPA